MGSTTIETAVCHRDKYSKKTKGKSLFGLTVSEVSMLCLLATSLWAMVSGTHGEAAHSWQPGGKERREGAKGQYLLQGQQ